MPGQAKPGFYVAVGLVVVALIAFAVYRADLFAPKATKDAGAGGSVNLQELEQKVEDPKAVTTKDVKEVVYVPRQSLPPVKGTAAYKPLKDRTVRFAINVWAGWAPIILANEGFQAAKPWKDADGKDFKVEVVLIDDPVKMRDAYAAGDLHIGWGTLDMVPLFLETFVNKDGTPKDSRIMPRIYQQVDWSNGGDGVVVREAVKTVADLRGKKVVLAQNSPSQ